MDREDTATSDTSSAQSAGIWPAQSAGIWPAQPAGVWLAHPRVAIPALLMLLVALVELAKLTA